MGEKWDLRFCPTCSATTSTTSSSGGIQNSNSAVPLTSSGIPLIKMMQAFRTNSTGSGNGNSSGSKRTSRLPSLHRSCDSSEDSSSSGK